MLVNWYEDVVLQCMLFVVVESACEDDRKIAVFHASRLCEKQLREVHIYLHLITLHHKSGAVLIRMELVCIQLPLLITGS